MIQPLDGIARVGDRLFFITSPRVGKAWPSANHNWMDETTVYATEPCGEEPVVVAHDVTRVFAIERWPKLALGCLNPAQDLVVLDPHGNAPPELLLANGCAMRWTEHGLVGISGYLPEEGGPPYWGGARFAPFLDGEPGFGPWIDRSAAAARRSAGSW